MGAVFLSASVPDPARSPEFAKTADTVAITAAVSALLYVTLGRRQLIWGGHPAITPMILVMAEDMKLNYGDWVHLYQSQYFEDEFPEDNLQFQNVTYTEKRKDRQSSLKRMRVRMFKENEFDAAVFIGGMQGILDEFGLFRRYHPRSAVLPVVSTGGATLELAKQAQGIEPDFAGDLDYVALFHRHLDIAFQELRYRHRSEQPDDVMSRMWKSDRLISLAVPKDEEPEAESE